MIIIIIIIINNNNNIAITIVTIIIITINTSNTINTIKHYQSCHHQCQHDDCDNDHLDSPTWSAVEPAVATILDCNAHKLGTRAQHPDCASVDGQKREKPASIIQIQAHCHTHQKKSWLQSVSVACESCFPKHIHIIPTLWTYPWLCVKRGSCCIYEKSTLINSKKMVSGGVRTSTHLGIRDVNWCEYSLDQMGEKCVYKPFLGNMYIVLRVKVWEARYSATIYKNNIWFSFWYMSVTSVRLCLGPTFE